MRDDTELAPAVDEPTTIHAPAPESSSPIAYSEALEVSDEPRRWHAPATLFLIAVLALIAASAGWFLIRPHVMPARPVPHPPALTAVKAAPIAAPTPPPTPPAPVPSAGLVDELAAADSADVQTAAPPAPKLQVIVLPPTAAVNDIFLRQLSVFGIVIENRDEAVSGAQRVCAALGQGIPPAAIVPEVIAGSDHITTLQAEGFIATAVNVYCPQFRR